MMPAIRHPSRDFRQPMQSIPLCPITGLPASRGTRPNQRPAAQVDCGVASFGVASQIVDSETSNISGCGESPCGLCLLRADVLVGDEAFYLELAYSARRLSPSNGMLRVSRGPNSGGSAGIVRAGAKVLDVGCGEAGPGAPSAARDPVRNSSRTAMQGAPSRSVRNESGRHRRRRIVPRRTRWWSAPSMPIERVADPLGFARDLAMCISPGGRLCVVVPSRVSRAMTEIPRLPLLNAPPHRLSWWNEERVCGRWPTVFDLLARSRRSRALLLRHHRLLDGTLRAQSDREDGASEPIGSGVAHSLGAGCSAALAICGVPCLRPRRSPLGAVAGRPETAVILRTVPPRR